MAEEYQFHLQRWTERDKSQKCPRCKKGHGCYKEYVDDNGVPVDTDNHLCGKCDHETSCGYHLTPKEWFKLNPGERRQIVSAEKPKREPKRIEIEGKWVGMFHRNTMENGNNFLRWIKTLPLTDDQRKSLKYIITMYALGTTRDGRVIWWQIDEHRIVRTGKIMQYNADGYRTKDAEGNSVGFGWVHAMFRRQYGWYPESEGYELQQCLFGQHLLPIVPDAEVHIVESEKTAFLMALLDPQAMTKKIWLATGGLFNINAAKLQPMKGRTIVCYPDTNGVEKWREALKGTDARLSTKWMNLVTDRDPKGADIADVWLRCKIDNYNKLKENPKVKSLIDKLNLIEQ